MMTPKIMLVTPAYDGQVHVQYAVALSETVLALSKEGVGLVSQINTSGSLLCAERNRLLEAFIKSDCTHVLCVDSDLGWPAQAVVEMLKKDVDFVGGVYPSRKDNVFTFRPVADSEGGIKVSDKGLIEMKHIPAGFMLIKRKAIQKMRDFFPELYFEPKHETTKHLNGYCLFQTELRNGEFWGEDYVFCRLAREAGITIWVDPLIEFDHAGVRGSLIQVLTSDKSKAEQNPPNQKPLV